MPYKPKRPCRWPAMVAPMAMAGAGGRTMVKLRIADALKGKRIVQFPTSDSAINLQQTDVNRFLESAGVARKEE